MVTGGVETSETDGKKVHSKYSVSVWNLAFDGTKVSPCIRTVEVDIFDKEREITSLRIFPVVYLDDRDEGKRRSTLIARGKRYFEYCKQPTFLQYTGPGLKKGAQDVSIVSV
jgi:hypothetical protein